MTPKVVVRSNGGVAVKGANAGSGWNLGSRIVSTVRTANGQGIAISRQLIAGDGRVSVRIRATGDGLARRGPRAALDGAWLHLKRPIQPLRARGDRHG